MSTKPKVVSYEAARQGPFAAAVQVLRLSCRPQRDLTDGELDEQADLYAKQLAAYHPGDVREACEDWASRVKWWPELAELLALVREKRDVREAAARPRIAPPVAPVEPRRPPSDAELLDQWRHNDALYQQTIAEPGTVPGAVEALQRVYAAIRGRRWTERPDLAASYYGDSA